MLIGFSTASYQNEYVKTNTDWEYYEKQGKLPLRNDSVNWPDRIYKDIDILKKHGFSIHRMSIEWGRVYPSEGKIDRNVVAEYKEILKYHKEIGIKTMLTLFHFTQPHWFAQKGGFLKKENFKYFLDFSRLIVEELGEYIDYLLILNEPVNLALKGYFNGIWPPFKKFDVLSTFRLYTNLSFLHNQAYKLIKSINPDIPTSSSHQLIAFSSDKNLIMRSFAFVSGFLANDYFFLITRKYHDFIGLNYYFRLTFTNDNIRKAFDLNKNDSVRLLENKLEKFGWSISALGFMQVMSFIKVFFPNKKILITEVGISGSRNQTQYMKQIFKYLKLLLKLKFDIGGLLWWTLVDNYEWDLGYGPKFGAIKITPRGRRILKKSFFSLKALKNELDMLDKKKVEDYEDIDIEIKN